MNYITLQNGVEMPQLGYGVYLIEKNECERCVSDALSVGYRLIDTAQAYHNEEEVGNAIRKSGIPREEIFLTTKLWATDHEETAAYQSVLKSMERLQTDYLDLILIHQLIGDVWGAWRALEKLYDEKKVRAIGISNFYPDVVVQFAQLNRICPMVNQIEVHPIQQQKEARKWLDKYNIQMEAWAPLGEGRNNLFENPTLKAIGEKYGKTSAQVMLRWHMQNGVVAIPKSTHKERMIENFNIFDFELSDEDMKQIADMDKAETLFFSHQDPALIDQFTNGIKAQSM